MMSHLIWLPEVSGPIPGQPVGKSEQAPASSPAAKISLISMSPDGGRIRYEQPIAASLA